MDEDRARSNDRAFAVSGTARIVAALALLGLVAYGSTARLRGSGTLAPSPVGGVALAFTVAVVAMLVVVALALAGSAARGDQRTRTKLLVTVLTALLLVALIASLHSLKPIGTPNQRAQCATREGIAPSRACAGRRKATLERVKGDTHRRASSWPALAAGVALLALLAVALGAAVLSRRTRRLVDEPDEQQHDHVLQALDESLDDLRRERDVRRAIIACYARMERALARSGTARAPSETPFEFLTRVLEHIARGPGRVLTELFERAKFSTEPLGEQDKQAALTALEALRASSGGR